MALVRGRRRGEGLGQDPPLHHRSARRHANFLHGIPHLRSRSPSSATASCAPAWSSIRCATRCSGPRKARARGSRTSACASPRARSSPKPSSPPASRSSASTARRSSSMTHRRARTKSPPCAASAPRRSISPGSRPGRFDGFWERGLSLWDIAAGFVLVQEAGGVVGTIETDGDLLAGQGLVAANANVFEAVRGPPPRRLEPPRGTAARLTARKKVASRIQPLSKSGLSSNFATFAPSR